MELDIVNKIYYSNNSYSTKSTIDNNGNVFKMQCTRAKNLITQTPDIEKLRSHITQTPQY
jgi:hypothetical protein